MIYFQITVLLTRIRYICHIDGLKPNSNNPMRCSKKPRSNKKIPFKAISLFDTNKSDKQNFDINFSSLDAKQQLQVKVLDRTSIYNLNHTPMSTCQCVKIKIKWNDLWTFHSYTASCVFWLTLTAFLLYYHSYFIRYNIIYCFRCPNN